MLWPCLDNDLSGGEVRLEIKLWKSELDTIDEGRQQWCQEYKTNYQGTSEGLSKNNYVLEVNIWSVVTQSIEKNCSRRWGERQQRDNIWWRTEEDSEESTEYRWDAWTVCYHRRANNHQMILKLIIRTGAILLDLEVFATIIQFMIILPESSSEK